MHEISITELQNLKIGQAENAQAGTGCTVFLLGENGAPVGLDVRGGGACFAESELLKPTAAAQVIHAILLGGGQRLWAGRRRRRDALPGGTRHRF